MPVRLLPSSLLLASFALLGCDGSGGGGGGYTATDTGASGGAWTGGGGQGEVGGGEAVAEVPPDLVRYVSPDGDDGADGTEGAPWRTVGHAVRMVGPSMKIVVAAGTYEGFSIDAVDGVEGGPIVITGEGSMPVFTSPIEIRRAHWVLEGLDVASREDKFSVRFTGDGSHDNVLRNSVVRDGTGAAGISTDLGARRILIEGNEVFAIDRGEVDAHGIVVQPTVREISILGNEIHGVSGDSVQCIGPGQDAVEGAPANQVVIEGNQMYDNRENAVDIKHCENVEIRGNVMHGFRQSSTSSGEAIVVHLLAKNVTVEENDVSGASRGIVTGRGATNVVLRRNVIHDLVDERTAVLFGEGSGLVASHNTIVGAEHGVRALDGSNVPTVANNIFSEVATPITGEASVGTNLFHDSPPTGDGAVEGDPMFDGEFAPGTGSDAIDAADAGDAAESCGAAHDLGAIERC